MLKLRLLTSVDETAFFQGLREWEGDDPSWYTFAWKPGMAYAEMLQILEKERGGRDLEPGRVPHSMLYGFLPTGEVIGRVSIRHELNEPLRKRGGHLGYSVAPRFRGKGYATEMVRQALEYCRGLGLKKILITCADSNVPSWKLVERFGGKDPEKVFDEGHGEMIRKYWVNL